MKKILIAAAFALAAVVSQAVTCTWFTTGINVLDKKATTVTSAWGFDTKNLTQSAFIALFAEGSTAWQTSGAEGYYEDHMACGGLDGYANGEKVNVWTAFFDDNGNVLISDIDSAAIGGAGQDPGLSLDVEGASVAGLFNAADGFKSAGWYSMQQQPIDTPEPTSGLMLLLGMAGLALRRRRA